MARDDAFWHELDTRFRRKLLQYVNARLLCILRRDENPGYAEDIVSETFNAAYRHFDRFDAVRGELEPWIFRIARNKMYDFLRAHKELRSEHLLEEAQLELEAGAQEPTFLYDKAAKNSPKTVALRKALKQLSRYDQELLICRMGNNLSYDEIERYFNFAVKKETLRVHVLRAESRLRREMAKLPEFAELMEERHGEE